MSPPPSCPTVAVCVAFTLMVAASVADAQAVDYVFVDGFETGVDCSAELTCPVPSAGKSCVAGRLSEAGSGIVMRAFFRNDQRCGQGAMGGPCNLTLAAHDAIAFAMDPFGSPPLASNEAFVDGCGRFLFANLTPPSSGFVGIVASNTADSQLHVTTATMRPLGANQTVERLQHFAARRDTVERWTLSAGSPFGASTFADVGSILLTFAAGGVPAAGVTATRDENAIGNQDYYFADASGSQRLALDSQLTSTGVNGAALIAQGAFGTYSGIGGEPAGCTWPSASGSAIPGVVSFIRIDCP